MKKKYTRFMIYSSLLFMGISMVVFPTEPSFDAEPVSGMEEVSSGLAVPTRSAAQLSAEIGKLLGNLKKPAFGQDGMPNSGREDSPYPTAGISTAPTPLPTPTLTPENNRLTAEVPQEIEELIRTYFTAILSDSFEEYKKLFYNNENVDEKLTQKRVEYIVRYHNIQCRAKSGAGPVDYVLYVLNDVEIATIDTLVPSMERFYIKYDEDGNPKIFLPDASLGPEESAYLDELNAMPDVQELIEDVTARMDEAVSSDADLRSFMNKLQGEP